MRTLGVSAVADGDERLGTSPDNGAAAPERLGVRLAVTQPDTRDDHGDRHAAPILIASLCMSSRLPFVRPSPDRCGRVSTLRESRPPAQPHADVAECCTGANVAASAPAAEDDDDHDDGNGAAPSATATAVLNFTFARRTARPLCRLPVNAVADGEERRDTLPDDNAAVTAWPGVTQPDTVDDRRDRLVAPIAIASVFTPSRLPFHPQHFLVVSASYACNSKPRNDLQHRSAGCVASADAKASIDPIVCLATSWGPDRFYIELVSPLDACALVISHLTQPAAGLRQPYAQARGGAVYYDIS